MSLAAVLFLFGFLFGAFVIPFGIQAGMTSWSIFLLVTVAQSVRTYAMFGVGVVATGPMRRRAARRGEPYPPASVARVADIAHARGVRVAGLVAPWLLASTAGLLIAAVDRPLRLSYTVWILIGTLVKFALFTAAWVVAFELGARLAANYAGG